MDEFLIDTARNLKRNYFDELTLVYGNESCDLDSAVCSIVYASFLHWRHHKIKCDVCTKAHRNIEYKDNIFVPVLNVNREDFDLKTEVVFCLKEYGIDAEKLIFRNDYNLEELVVDNKANVVLVDHHFLARKDRFLASYVTEIIDHRPLDKKGWMYRDEVRSTIYVVGSCSTLVCNRIKELAEIMKRPDQYFETYPISAELLHSAIIMDTVNFSKNINKATPLDEEIILYLESIIKPQDFEKYRQEKFDKLTQARKDVSTLNTGQLLRKDEKIVDKFAASSFPIPVKEFLQRPNVENAMLEHLSDIECSILVLLGMKIDGNTVTRDLAIYSIDQYQQYVAQVAQMLEEWSYPNLQLKALECSINNCKLYEQGNLTASRKQIIPVLNDFLDKYHSSLH